MSRTQELPPMPSWITVRKHQWECTHPRHAGATFAGGSSSPDMVFADAVDHLDTDHFGWRNRPGPRQRTAPDRIADILDGSTNDPDGAHITGVTFTVQPDGRYLAEVQGDHVHGITGLMFDTPNEWADALEDLLDDRRKEANR